MAVADTDDAQNYPVGRFKKNDMLVAKNTHEV